MKTLILLICMMLICCPFAFGKDSDLGNLNFRVNKKFLWIPDKETIEESKKEVTIKKDMFAELTLPGELYDTPHKIKDVKKKKVDRSTPEGLVASYLSANKAGDFDWLVSNFLDTDKEAITKIFNNEKAMKMAQDAAQTITEANVTGFAKYKDYTLLFLQQSYKQGNGIIEALTCKETEDGWKLTNSLSEDKTFDIVFAAITEGKVWDSTKKKAKALKPEARFIR